MKRLWFLCAVALFIFECVAVAQSINNANKKCTKVVRTEIVLPAWLSQAIPREAWCSWYGKLNTSNPVAALHTLQGLLDKDPHNKSLWLYKGIAHLHVALVRNENHHFDRALTAFSKTDIGPDPGIGGRCMAITLLARGDIGESITMLQSYLLEPRTERMYSANLEDYKLLARAYYYRARKEPNKKDLQRAAKIEELIGNYHFQFGDWSKASRHYARSLTVWQEKNPLVVAKLAKVKYQQKKWQDSIDLTKAFYEMDPQTPKVLPYLCIGSMYGMLGKWSGDGESAESYFNKAIELAKKYECIEDVFDKKYKDLLCADTALDQEVKEKITAKCKANILWWNVGLNLFNLGTKLNKVRNKILAAND